MSEKLPETETDRFQLNKAVAYQGKIGKQRQDFCIDYIRHKQKVYKDMELGALELVGSALHI